MEKTWQRSLRVFVAVLLIFAGEAHARRGSASRASKPRSTAVNCPAGIASSTNYFVPNLKDYCSNGKVCSAFESAVRMQGSGIMPGNQMLVCEKNSRGRWTLVKRDAGTCDTARGAWGSCLRPFISVAADPKYYRKGDVIEVPAMRGREIPMPDGSKIVHPGYFVVEDTGSAIKGSNRFDFFTGALRPSDKANIFGYFAGSGSEMSDKKSCESRKAFTVHRARSDQAETALAAIDDAMRGAQKASLAMNAPAKSNGGVQ